MNTPSQPTAADWNAPHDLTSVRPGVSPTLNPFDLVWHLYGPGRLIYDYDIYDILDGALPRLQERLAPYFAGLGINPAGVFPFDLVETMHGEHGLCDIAPATLSDRVWALSEALRRGLEKASDLVLPEHPALPKVAKYLADELERKQRSRVGLDRTAVTSHVYPSAKSEGDHGNAAPSRPSEPSSHVNSGQKISKLKTLRLAQRLTRRLILELGQ